MSLSMKSEDNNSKVDLKWNILQKKNIIGKQRLSVQVDKASLLKPKINVSQSRHYYLVGRMNSSFVHVILFYNLHYLFWTCTLFSWLVCPAGYSTNIYLNTVFTSFLEDRHNHSEDLQLVVLLVWANTSYSWSHFCICHITAGYNNPLCLFPDLNH